MDSGRGRRAYRMGSQPRITALFAYSQPRAQLSLYLVGNTLVVVMLAVIVLPRISPRILRSRALWLVAVVVVFRAITNLLATGLTQAIYVQLITLMTPFFVALLSWTLSICD